MTVGQLEKLLVGVPKNTIVLIPEKDKHNGVFYTPCPEDSGHGEIYLGNYTEEQILEMELLNQKIPTKKVFFLLPENFDDDDNINLFNENINLN